MLCGCRMVYFKIASGNRYFKFATITHLTEIITNPCGCARLFVPGLTANICRTRRKSKARSHLNNALSIIGVVFAFDDMVHSETFTGVICVLNFTGCTTFWC